MQGREAHQKTPATPQGTSAQPCLNHQRRRQRFKREERSLVLFIKSLVERKVVVELRNDVIVRGKLEDVDEWMNLTLSAAVQQFLNGATSEYEFLYVKGRNIRYVHLPRTLDPAKSIDNYRKRITDEKIAQAKANARQAGQRLPKGADSIALHTAAMQGTVDEDTESQQQSYTLYGASYLNMATEAEDLYYSSSGDDDQAMDDEALAEDEQG